MLIVAADPETSAGSPMLSGSRLGRAPTTPDS